MSAEPSVTQVDRRKFLLEGLEHMLGSAETPERKERAWTITIDAAARMDWQTHLWARDLKHKISALSADHAEFARYIAEHEDLEVQVQTSEEKITALLGENHEFKEQVLARDKELEAENEKVMGLMSQNASLKKRVEDLMDQIDALKNEPVAKKAKTSPEEQGEGGGF